MAERSVSDWAIVDVRHTNRDETVICSLRSGCGQWASYAVESSIDPRTLHAKPVRTYLCRKHMTEFLLLSDALGMNQMPPIVRLWLWYRLLGELVGCHHCDAVMGFAYFHFHMTQQHFGCPGCRLSYVRAFDRAMAPLLA